MANAEIVITIAKVKKIKLINFLEAIESFSGELYTKDWESRHSFEWDNAYITLTEEGKKKFEKLLNSEIRINTDKIEIQDPIPEELYQLFMEANAGYVSTTDYDKWFKKTER